MTQLESAKQSKITPQMREVAAAELMDVNLLCQSIASGRAVIPFNKSGRCKKSLGIGENMRTKVNANIGMTDDFSGMDAEINKLNVCIDAGADAVMDLSCGPNAMDVLRAILDKSPIAIGTVPIYGAAVLAMADKGHVSDMTEKDMFDSLEMHAKSGVDFFTVHCGVTMELLARLKKKTRVMDVVSRGGAFLLEWMNVNKKENPLYEKFDIVIDIAKRYDVTLSLGDGMRPGCTHDATDNIQIKELAILGELAKRAYDAGVQVIIEGPGHVPINQIEANVLLEKRLCNGAPFYVLGPLVTDVAPGYDHITAAIGGAIAAAAGADFLCYVTPSEHLRLPNLDDVREGIIASRIAAHAGDIAKGVPGAAQWDLDMSRMRKKRDWEGQFKLAIDPAKPRKMRGNTKPSSDDVCTMCNRYCSMKLLDSALSV